jgi:regulator of PEP synthase PpsR (kinase-PPPase family)
MPLVDAGTRKFVVISDSTGETASRAARVGLEQFFEVRAIERRFVNVRTKEKVEEAIRFAAEHKAFVIYTLVSTDLRDSAGMLAEECGVPAVDLLRDILPIMAQWLGQAPGNAPGHRLNDSYFRRMSALDFVNKFDDGQRIEDLERAEVLILGLSRSSKSPLCQWLGKEGIKAANVPLILEVPTHPKIFEFDPRRVFVLTMQASRLQSLRTTRLKEMGARSSDQYVDMAYINKEIAMVRGLLAKNPGWTPIEVTMRAIEEAAAVVLSHLQQRFGNGESH